MKTVVSITLNNKVGYLVNITLDDLLQQATAQVENPVGSCNAWCKTGNQCTLRFVDGSIVYCVGKTPDGW